MLKLITVTGLSMLILFSSSGNVFSQEEESFIREAVISKRDAVVLSVLFPGLGQMTEGQKVKGVTFFLGEAASLIVAINVHENYQTKQKTYVRDLDIYKKLAVTPGKTYVEASRMYHDLKDKNDELDNLNTIRNTMFIIAAGIYAYNIIDAIFFSSSLTESRRAEHDTHDKIVVKSALIDRNPGIVLSKRF